MKKGFVLFLAVMVVGGMSPLISADAATVKEVSVSNNTLTITGSGFGTRDLQSVNGHIEWQGGETASTVADRAVFGGGTSDTADVRSNGWFNEYIGGLARYDKVTKYSGNQSIVFDSTYSKTADGRFHLSYDPGRVFTNGQTAYATWLTKISFRNNTMVAGQWKMFRMGWTQHVSDNYPQHCMFNWFANGSKDADKRITFSYESSYAKQCPWLDKNIFPAPEDDWARVEIAIKTSTGTGFDGHIRYRIYKLNTAASGLVNNENIIQWDYNNITTYAAEAPERRIRYFIFQNYMGNGLSGYTTAWLDNIYMQEGVKRVEVGDTPEWSNTKGGREVLVPSKWADGSISIDLALADNANTIERIKKRNSENKAYIFVVVENPSYSTSNTATEVFSNGVAIGSYSSSGGTGTTETPGTGDTTTPTSEPLNPPENVRIVQ